ncbi:MAG: hypothetical protein ABIR33_01320 [Pyrinomonadaceae bacterium]
MSKLADEKRLILVFSALRSRECFPIMLKGWSVARFYDPGHFRASNDIDLLFPESPGEVVSGTLSTIPSTIAIDAHFGPRHLDKLTFQQLFEKSYEVEIEGVPIRVLADEDNLRITAVHWLTDGGVNKERLQDIFYLVKNRKEDFDWVRCLESNGSIRKTWVLSAIATARIHLNLDVSGLPEEARQFQLPTWYSRTLEKEWRLGPYTRRILSTVLFRPSLLIEQLRRKVPPNPIAASIDTEKAIDNSSRLPAQLKSILKKMRPFARGVGRRITYSIRGRES